MCYMGNEYSSSINFKNNFFFCNIISHFLENHQELIAINRAVIWLSLEQQNMRLTPGMGSAGCWPLSVWSVHPAKGCCPLPRQRKQVRQQTRKKGQRKSPLPLTFKSTWWNRNTPLGFMWVHATFQMKIKHSKKSYTNHDESIYSNVRPFLDLN